MARAIVFQAGPLVVAAANNIATTQSLSGAGRPVVLNGTTDPNSVINNIATSQVVTGAGSVVLNGSAVVGGVGYVPFGTTQLLQKLQITSAGNDSAVTVTVFGTQWGLFGPVGVVDSFLLSNASVASSNKAFSTVTSITTSGTTSSIQVGTYGIATLDIARRIGITSAGNDSGINFTITGYDWSGSNIYSEVLAGANAGVATSVLDYSSILSITPSGATASTITVGTVGSVGSPWARTDEFAAMGPTSLQIDGSGTVNWTVQQTLDDPTGTTNIISPASIKWVNHQDPNLVGSVVTTGVQSNYAYPPKFVRIVLNSQTNPGFVAMTLLQNYQR